MAILDYYESHHDEAPDRKIFFEEVHDNCDWISFAHHHRAIEFCFVRSGNVKCCIDGKLIEISAGEIAYIDSFNVHYFYIGENCDRIAIVIGADFLKDFFTVYNKKDRRARFLCKLYDKEKNAELFAYVGAWLKQYDGLNELQNLGKLNYFLGLVAAKYGVEYEDRKDDNLAAKLLNYISEHFREEVDLEVLSVQFGYSKNTISRTLHSILGKDLRTYINILRVRATEKLLSENGKLTISEAAFQCGFNSMKTYYRAYGVMFGSHSKGRRGIRDGDPLQ